MNRNSVLLYCMLGFLCQAEGFSDKQTECIRLNNEGVIALNKKDWQLASDKFQEALKLDPDYSLARNNLVITHGQHGVQLRLEHKMAESLKELHQAADTGPYWNRELDETIMKLGKNPKSFEDRIDLAEQSSADKDYLGAVVEYRAALIVRNDVPTRRKLADLYVLMGDESNGAAEYDTIKRIERREQKPPAP